MRSQAEARTTALVVGAGPVGLTAALALRRHGIDVRVLEAEREERTRPGSRAIFIHRATLRLLEELHPGLGFRLAAQGLVWPVKRTTFRGKEVYRKEYPPPGPGVLPPFSSLPQHEIERQLYAACAASGVPFSWEAKVDEVQTHEGGVRLTTTFGDAFEADYLIGADGAHSAVRPAAGIALEGPRSSNAFVVVDLFEDAAHPLPLERVFHY